MKGVVEIFSKGVTTVINRLIGFFLSQRRLLNAWELPVTGLLLTVGLSANLSALATTMPQQSDQSVDATTIPLLKAVRAMTIAQTPTLGSLIPDGTYLYGQSPVAEQVGQEYLVFEARQGKVIGAVYLPNSEFSCFYGTLDSKQLDLTVVNPYDQTAYSHTIARIQPAQIAAAGGQINLENTYDSLTYPHTIQLEGYQPISEISTNDQQILSVCLNDYQKKV